MLPYVVSDACLTSRPARTEGRAVVGLAEEGTAPERVRAEVAECPEYPEAHLALEYLHDG